MSVPPHLSQEAEQGGAGDGWQTLSQPCQSNVFLMLGPIASIMRQIMSARMKSGMPASFSTLCLLIRCSSSFLNSLVTILSSISAPTRGCCLFRFAPGQIWSVERRMPGVATAPGAYSILRSVDHLAFLLRCGRSRPQTPSQARTTCTRRRTRRSSRRPSACASPDSRGPP